MGPDRVRRPPSAVRQLDGREHPILFLWASDDPILQMIDEFSERLEVLGGANAYWLAGTFGGYFQRRLFDPAGGYDEVELYPPRIELGFGSPARHVTPDVELVLRATRYYSERGEFDPSVSWEARQPAEPSTTADRKGM